MTTSSDYAGEGKKKKKMRNSKSAKVLASNKKKLIASASVNDLKGIYEVKFDRGIHKRLGDELKISPEKHAEKNRPNWQGTFDAVYAPHEKHREMNLRNNGGHSPNAVGGYNGGGGAFSPMGMRPAPGVAFPHSPSNRSLPAVRSPSPVKGKGAGFTVSTGESVREQARKESNGVDGLMRQEKERERGVHWEYVEPNDKQKQEMRNAKDARSEQKRVEREEMFGLHESRERQRKRDLEKEELKKRLKKLPVHTIFDTQMARQWKARKLIDEELQALAEALPTMDQIATGQIAAGRAAYKMVRRASTTHANHIYHKPLTSKELAVKMSGAVNVKVSLTNLLRVPDGRSYAPESNAPMMKKASPEVFIYEHIPEDDSTYSDQTKNNWYLVGRTECQVGQIHPAFTKDFEIQYVSGKSDRHLRFCVYNMVQGDRGEKIGCFIGAYDLNICKLARAIRLRLDQRKYDLDRYSKEDLAIMSKPEHQNVQLIEDCDPALLKQALEDFTMGPSSQMVVYDGDTIAGHLKDFAADNSKPLLTPQARYQRLRDNKVSFRFPLEATGAPELDDILKTSHSKITLECLNPEDAGPGDTSPHTALLDSCSFAHHQTCTRSPELLRAAEKNPSDAAALTPDTAMEPPSYYYHPHDPSSRLYVFSHKGSSFVDNSVRV